MNRYLIIPIAGAFVIGALVVKPGSIRAQDAASNPRDSLIQKLVTRFNLNQSDVQAVFDEHRNEHLQQMQGMYEARLTQLVTDGKITPQQKQLILEKHQQLQAKREADRQSDQNLTPAARRTRIEAERAELQTWAEQNGIDLSTVMFFGGHGMGKGMRGDWK